MRGTEPGHVADLLPAYLNGTLEAGEEHRVDEHLRGCAACRAELSSWEVIRGAVDVSQSAVPAPSPTVLDGALARIAREEARPSPLAPRLSLAWQLLLGQLPLVRRELWLASALTVGLGCLVALLVAAPSEAGGPLAVLAPVIAAVGVSLVYGPENDASLEIALSTPTPPRLVLLARLVLVYGYDLALALAASAVVALTRAEVGLWPLVELWLGPMFFLSALALLLSLVLGPTPAVMAAMTLWATKLVATSEGTRTLVAPGWADRIGAFWQANPILLPLAAALLAAAVLLAPRPERLA